MFSVIWTDEALDELADVYVRSDLPAQDKLAGIVAGFNTRLATDPEDVGESRAGTFRIAFEKPAAISFEVNTQTRWVYVTHFWTF